MHFTFLLFVSLIGATRAVVDGADHAEVSPLQYGRHYARAAAEEAARVQQRSRRSSELNISSILAVATASVDTLPTHDRPPASAADIATLNVEGPSTRLASLSSFVLSAIGQVTSGLSRVISSTVASALSSEGTDTKTSTSSVISSISPSTSTTPTKSTIISATLPTGSSTHTASEPTSSISLRDMLLPIKPISYWTTAEGLTNALPLNDDTLTPTHEVVDLKHTYLRKAGKSAMSAFYPNGTWNLINLPHGGLSFYATGPKTHGIDLSTAKEVTFGYSVYFPEGFDFVLGGKLPGLWGGDSLEGTLTCSGGSRRDNCFSSRVMWRTNGDGELYTYLPPSFPANQGVCNTPPYSECNPQYGASIARGSFTFATGNWTTVAMRVKFNDVGMENGELQLWANGKSRLNVNGLVLRDSAEGLVRGAQMQTFFGGSTREWSTPMNQSTYFADFTMAVTDTF